MNFQKSGGEYFAGVDSGSASTDAVIIDKSGKIVGKSVLPTGGGAQKSASQALDAALADAGLRREQITRVVATGYGRANIGGGDGSVTEISCHAKGAHRLCPAARTVIDIGGQDSKIISIDGDGKVLSFAMNDKCAAGTGRFLEMMARTLGLSLEEMSEAGLKWKNDIVISSTCTVFAESEVVSLVAENRAVSDIVHGLNNSVAAKITALMGRLDGKPQYIMTGGVARNQGVVRAIEDRIGEKLYICPEAQICGALGAALFAGGFEEK
jgi:predicted CoA-substrate-specific enzyme activase